ncbi:hypothetical protein GCM10025881_39690 [Pseudolysinimonas kribbensis]|uniref:DUF1905 domain-containing protein n=1 Tax=Pseudolysinimonas kribbensis TaxID=433641 RepID=A0ABQ6JY49_9MICO|nr:hypothetical protein GCM10025881_00610 [Pseudolysinimonas kribbensis]GMA97145.1 hypothetical protein GCM10025881_39690 [Pseudolysinimonas kribbensis]
MAVRLAARRRVGGDRRAARSPRGFESLRVDVTLGASTWRTSIFPGGDGRYTMPVKRAVYEKEGVDEGDTARVSIRLLDVG